MNRDPSSTSPNKSENVFTLFLHFCLLGHIYHWKQLLLKHCSSNLQSVPVAPSSLSCTTPESLWEFVIAGTLQLLALPKYYSHITYKMYIEMHRKVKSAFNDYYTMVIPPNREWGLCSMPTFNNFCSNSPYRKKPQDPLNNFFCNAIDYLNFKRHKDKNTQIKFKVF